MCYEERRRRSGIVNTFVSGLVWPMFGGDGEMVAVVVVVVVVVVPAW